MAVIKVPGPISGKQYSAKIVGDSPTVDEQKKIDAFVSQREQAFQTKYAQRFGAPIATGESTGIANLLGEIPKGIARGAVNFGESALLGAAAALPESWETPAREYIRRGAYDIAPQADIGLEGSLPGTVSEGIGSMAIPYAVSLIPGAGKPLAAGLSMLAGAGESSENARAAGATPEQRGTAAFLGLGAGALDILPVHRAEKVLETALGTGATKGIKDILGRAAVQGGFEGAQEAVQQLAQNLIAKGVYDPEKDVWADTGSSAGLGGGTGALVSLLMELIPGRQHVTTPTPAPTIAPTATPPAPTAIPPATATAPAPAEPAPVEPGALSDEERAARDAAHETELAGGVSAVPIDELVPRVDVLGTAARLAGVNKEGISTVEAPKVPEKVTTPQEQAVLDRITALDLENDGEVIEPFNAVNMPTGTAPTSIAPQPTFPGEQPWMRDWFNKLQAGEVPEGTVKSSIPPVPDLATYVAAESMADDLAEKVSSDEGKTQRVKLSDLRTTQGSISGQDSTSTALPKVANISGTLVVMDGNHRVDKAIRDGETEIEVRVTDVTPVEQAAAETTAGKIITPEQPPTATDDRELARAKQHVEWMQIASVPNLVDWLEVDAKVAEDLLNKLEAAGIVSAPNANGKRRVLTAAPRAQQAVTQAAQQTVAKAPSPTQGDLFAARDDQTEAELAQQVKPKLEPVVEETAPAIDPEALFNQVVSGERQTLTPEEALAIPDEMLASEPQPKLIPLKKLDEEASRDEQDAMKRAKVANAATMQSWQARQAVRRKIVAAKNAAQVERQAEERRAARVPEAPGFAPPIAQTSADANTLPQTYDKSTLKPKPLKLNPDRFTLGRRNRKLTGTPTKAWVEVLEEREARSPTGNDPALGNTYAAAIKDFFETKTNAAFRRYREYVQGNSAIPDIEDTTVHTDKQAVLNLLQYRGNLAAYDFFSRFPNIMEALQEIGAVSVFNVPGQPIYTTQVSKKSKTAREDALDIREGNERAKLTGADKFYENIHPKDAAKAREWVTRNLSRKAQIVMNQAANSTKTEIEESMKANSVISTAHDAVVAETPTAELQVEAALGRVTSETQKETQAMRRKLERQAERAKFEANVAAPTNIPENLKVGAATNLGAVPYKKGETSADAIIRQLYETGTITDESTDAEILEAVEAFEAATRSLFSNPLLRLLDSAVDTMALPLQPSVVGTLRAGNLQATLIGIGLTHPNPLIARIAMKMSGAVGTTKTRVVDDLRAEDGTAVAGLFSPATNELLFDSKTGLNAHVVMHEMGHATLSHTLADSSHPTTQAVQEVYDSVKDLLSTYYGSQSLQEFAAEALTNREFRGELARLHPNGDPISAWTRFSDAVLNFLRTMVGKPRKLRDSALSTLDDVLTASIAPAPAARDAGMLYMASSAAGASDTIRLTSSINEKIKRVTPGSMRAVADQFLDVVGNDPLGAVSDNIMGSRNLPLLVEMAKTAQLPAAVEIERLINKMTSEQAAAAQRLTGMQKVFEETRDSADPADYARFKMMMDKGNIAAVQANRRLGTYTDRDQNTVHQELNVVYRSLPQNLRTMADALWANYPRQNQVLMDAITDNLNTMTSEQGVGIPAATKTSLLKSFQARLLASSTMLDGYQPMVREGSYWLRYSARATPTSEPETVYQTFSTNAERSRAIAALATMPEVERDAAGNVVYDATPRLSIASFRRAPDGSFVKGVMTLLDQAHVPDETKERFMAMVIELMPESSFAKSLQRRQGFPGYEQDPVEAFRIKAFQTARQTERLRYSRQINDAVQTLTDEWNRGGVVGTAGVAHNPATKALVEELRERAAFAVNPPADQLAEKVTRATFGMTIGWNVSSVVVQTGTIGVVVAPNLAARYKTAPTMRAISAAVKTFTNSGLSRLQDMPQTIGGTNTVKVRAAPSIDNPFVVVDGEYTVRTDLGLTPEQTAQLQVRIPLIKALSEANELSRSAYYDSFGFETAGRKKSLFSRVSTLMGGAFHLAERMNRQVTALATYDLHYAQLKQANPNASEEGLRKLAADEAVRLTRKLNGGTSLNEAPRWTQKGMGRIVGMFRNYGMHMTHMQIQYFKEAVGMETRAFQRKLASGEIPSTPENLQHLEQLKADAKIALKSTLGMWGASFLLAGVSGVPMFNAVAMMVNALLLGDDEDDFETIVRKHIGEGWYKGWLTEGTGMDISGRIGLSGLLLRADRFNSNPSEADTFMNYFGGPAWATGVRFSRGVKELLGGGDIERGIEQMLPAAFSSFAKAVRYANEGMTTRRGDPVVDDVTTGNIIGQTLGFAPTSYTMNQERNQVLKRIDTAVGKERTKLMKSVYMSMRKGDSEARAAALKKIAEFNQRNPNNQIQPEDLMRSLKQHQQTTEDMYNGITINPANRAALMQNARDWDQGWQLF